MKSFAYLLCILSAAGPTLSLPVTKRDIATQQDLFQRDIPVRSLERRTPASIMYEALEKRKLEPDPQGSPSQGFFDTEALAEAEPDPQENPSQAITKRTPDRYGNIVKKDALAQAENGGANGGVSRGGSGGGNGGGGSSGHAGSSRGGSGGGSGGRLGGGF
jgi:hypothetical protein